VLVSESAARNLLVLPLRLESNKLHVVMADPLDTRIGDLLSVLPVDEIELHIAPAEEIRSAVNACYRALAEVSQHVEAFRTTEAERSLAAAGARIDAGDDAPIIQVVNKILTQALRDRASDVHIEPTDVEVRVRFRVDGALIEVLSLPSDMGPALVSRIKIMAEMNIVERRRPQDGQFEMAIDGRVLDVRVSTTSTICNVTVLGMPLVLHFFGLAIVTVPKRTSMRAGRAGRSLRATMSNT